MKGKSDGCSTCDPCPYTRTNECTAIQSLPEDMSAYHPAPVFEPAPPWISEDWNTDVPASMVNIYVFMFFSEHYLANII